MEIKNSIRTWWHSLYHAGWVTQLLVAAAFILIFVTVVFVGINGFQGARDAVHDWWFDKKDAQAAEEVQGHLISAAEHEKRMAEKDAEIQKFKTKYEAAIRAMDLANGKGAEIDEAIEQQIQRVEDTREGSITEPVPDTVLLERLRARDTKR
jgi:hypothetical protein